MTRRATLGPVNEWARSARVAAGFRTTDEAAAALGPPFTGGYVRSLESGHIDRPRPDRLVRLEEVYGSKAPEPEVDAPAGAAEIVSALDQLGHELRHLAQAQAGYSEALLALLGALAPEAAEALDRLGSQTDRDTRRLGDSDPVPSSRDRDPGATK